MIDFTTLKKNLMTPFTWFRRAIREPLKLAILAAVPVLVVAGEGQLKELLDRFVNGCVFVVEKTVTPQGHILVIGHLAGTPPERLPLTFEGRNGALINSLEFDAAYRDGSDDDPTELAFHPFTGRTCPGLLCEITSPNRPVFTIVLTDLKVDFQYRFRVRLLERNSEESKASNDRKLQNLRTYAVFDSGLPGGVCRVQPPRWFNYWVWASTTQKALTFILVIVVGGLLLKWSGQKE